ncbi:MAG TPA: polysaccharide deacetylase family sporulation protein PdaB [Bacilli bacterium]
MNVFIIVNKKKLKRVLFLAITAIFALGAAYSQKNGISVFSRNEPAAIYSVQTSKKVIALTFDISWGENRLEPILNILKQKGVTNATFFLSSPWSKTHPELVKKIVDGGFEIGSHGHKFAHYSTLEDSEIRRQIATAHQILTEMTGRPPKLLRLPNGDFDKRVLRIAGELGYTVIQWDTDSLDWMNIGADNIVNRVVTKAHPGDIVLMHASDSCKQTHIALPVIIDKLREKGYEFVTVSQLINETQLSGREVEDNQ